VTDWQPGDPLYPCPIPWTQAVYPAAVGHRDGGYCWCEHPEWRPHAGASRYTPEFPPPRFHPVPTLDEAYRNHIRLHEGDG
jgi:hypothetical protein